jgi:hypothetical protein
MPCGTNNAPERRAAASPDNQQVAAHFREMAHLLDEQDADGFRIRAYRRGAETLEGLNEPVSALFDEKGLEGLDALPGIGPGLASAIAEILITGGWQRLERLRGRSDPVGLFRRVPGIGSGLATAIHDTLHLDTLEAVAQACADGTLARVPGIGPRRVASIEASIRPLLASRASLHARPGPIPASEEPAVETLLAIDEEYRAKAAAGRLRTIAPLRMNPEGKAWLPVLHTTRDGWHFTALFSNTTRAHRLGMTRDWVVIYFHDASHVERLRTVVTETRGSLAGLRVVRGREVDCLTARR